MRSHLQRDLDQLTKKLLGVGAMVEQAIHKSLRALLEGDIELAKVVQVEDDEIDSLEIEVEEECLKVLALHAPVAADLRLVISYLKVNNDLERMGDLACNVAARTESLLLTGDLDLPNEIRELAEIVPPMVRKALDAVVKGDNQLAREVLNDDEAVDATHERIYGVVSERVTAGVQDPQLAIQFVSISRYLERTADLATNIAEDVVFMTDGEVIRHRG